MMMTMKMVKKSFLCNLTVFPPLFLQDEGKREVRRPGGQRQVNGSSTASQKR